MAPSGPATIPVRQLPVVGTANSVIVSDGVMRASWFAPSGECAWFKRKQEWTLYG